MLDWHTVRNAETGDQGLAPADLLASHDSPDAQAALLERANRAAGLVAFEGAGAVRFDLRNSGLPA